MIGDFVVLIAKDLIHPLNFLLSGCEEIGIFTACSRMIALDNLISNMNFLTPKVLTVPIALVISLLYLLICALAKTYIASRIFKYSPWLCFLRSRCFNYVVIVFFIYLIINNLNMYFGITQPFDTSNPEFNPLNNAVESLMCIFIYLKLYRKHITDNQSTS